MISDESIKMMNAASSMTLVACIVALDEANNERLIGEYTFHHTRTMS